MKEIKNKLAVIKEKNISSISFNKPLSLDKLLVFEQKHNIVLPNDYKSFISEIGNGGSGPNYGVLSFEESLIDFKLDGKPLIDISTDFPYEQNWNEEWISTFDWDNDRPDMEVVNNYMDVRHISGCLQISHYGHGCTNLLIVKGKSKDQIWFDGRADYGGISPEQDENGQTFTFFDWYSSWIDSLLNDYKVK